MRRYRPDPALTALNEARDHLAIQVSLLANAETPDPARLKDLRLKLEDAERKIFRCRLPDDGVATP